MTMSDTGGKFALSLFEEPALQELKRAIKQNNLLMSGLIVAKHFQPNINIAEPVAQLEQIIVQAGQKTKDCATPNEKFSALIQFFYNELAFSGDENDFFASKYNLLNRVIGYRTGIPVSLAIVFCQIGNAIGLKLKGVNFPGHFLVRCKVSEERSLFMDPLNGKILPWNRLQELYNSILGEQAEDSMPEELLEPVGVGETVIRLLHNLKSAYINEENYADALASVDLLVQLCPQDPYERRDRGFLLHQLECPKVALADYQFFIKHCPEDPSTPLLKIQLKQLQRQAVVFH